MVTTGTMNLKRVMMALDLVKTLTRRFNFNRNKTGKGNERNVRMNTLKKAGIVRGTFMWYDYFIEHMFLKFCGLFRVCS